MNNTKKVQIIRIVSLFGIIAGVFYFLHIILGKKYYNGYDPLSQAISDLTALNSPSKKIASIFSFIYGVFNIIFVIGFYKFFKGKINKTISFGSGVFCIMALISFLGYTFFPLSEAGYAGTFQDKMHIFVTIAVVVFTIITIILFSIGFLKTKNYKYIGIISIIAFIFLITGAILINILPNEYFGVAERINVYTVIVYTGILSLWMNRYIIKNGIWTNVT